MTSLDDLIQRAKERGFSMRYLAERAGVSQCLIHSIVLGKRHPTTKLLEKIREVVGHQDEKLNRPDLEPGYWGEYREPSELGRAIQYPLSDPYWQSRVINAYRKARSYHAREQGQ